MYKIIGNHYDEKVNTVYTTPAYALGVYMAYVEKWIPSKFSTEAVSAGKDIFNNNLPHRLIFSADIWLELCKEV